MENVRHDHHQGPATRPRLRLPFEKRPTDPGTWSYIHRRGISITVILYLVVAIAFLWWKFDLGGNLAMGSIVIEFPEELLREEAVPEPVEVDRDMWEDYRDVRNLASNENAELNSDLRDSKGINASELYNNAGSVDDKIKANRDAYEAGLRQNEEMLNSARNGQDNGEQTQTSKAKGNVTVEYSFVDPVRNHVRLPVPAYKCEGGGMVVVSVVIDRNGFVTSSSVDRASSSGDACLQSMAISAARDSRFNVDTSAPSKHKGTITYIFVPQ